PKSPMAKTATKTTTKTATRKKPTKVTPSARKLGNLPEWDLTDLYPGIDSPEIKWDLENAENQCVEFERAYKGKLAEMAGRSGGGDALTEAVKRYEALDDRLGKLISYASLLYAGNTSDPQRAKFYGDVQERITSASIHLLFFTLELNRVDDAALDAAMAAPSLGHYRPWIEDVRKEKPYQLEDRVEQLFHEKSVTGRGAWNRLFDETMTSLRFTVDGQELAIEPVLNLFQDSDEAKRHAASDALAATFK